MRAVVVSGLVAVVAATVWWYGRPPAGEIVPSVETVPVAHAVDERDERLTVHVSGAVLHPGLVAVTPGSRVADVISAAGGVTGEADLTGINLAAPVADAQQVVVPGRGETAGATSGTPSAGDGMVHLNRATAAEVENLPGVGPVLARRIIEHRDAFGPFSAVEDLLDVPGIGETKLAALRDRVVVP